MWSPTHVQVTVQRSQGLLCKGKGSTNDAFVTIGLGKEKYQTSVKEKASENVEWREKCELQIPNKGNKAEIILTVLHHNFLGVDEFLGCVSIPLADMDVYERPRNRWYKLGAKPGKDKNKDRGELEVKIAFIVKAGSLSDLSKKEKHKSSLGQLSQVLGGSLISLSSLDKRKGLKKFASKIGQKIKKKHKDKDSLKIPDLSTSKQVEGDADPGVISEVESDDEFALDELSHKGSGSSLNLNSTASNKSSENISNFETSTPIKSPRRIITTSETISSNFRKNQLNRDFVKNLSGNISSSFFTTAKDDDSQFADKIAQQTLELPYENKGSMERIIIGKEGTRSSSPVNSVPQETFKQYVGRSKEELIGLIVDLQCQVTTLNKHQRDLEEYIDNLLLRVMETTPKILQNPYSSGYKINF